MRELRDGGLALAWEPVDVADDDELFKRYGWSIPVLRRPDGEELGWPFDLAALQSFVNALQPDRGAGP